VIRAPASLPQLPLRTTTTYGIERHGRHTTSCDLVRKRCTEDRCPVSDTSSNHRDAGDMWTLAPRLTAALVQAGVADKNVKLRCLPHRDVRRRDVACASTRASSSRYSVDAGDPGARVHDPLRSDVLLRAVRRSADQGAHAIPASGVGPDSTSASPRRCLQRLRGNGERYGGARTVPSPNSRRSGPFQARHIESSRATIFE